MDFIRLQCGVADPLPGFVTENHGELFPLWREAIGNGTLQAPFHVTHVDAHADLGLGDAGYVFLLTELVHLDPIDRQHPPLGMSGLNDGNHLAFAIACRWIADLEYVFCAGGGDDEMPYMMGDFDPKSRRIELPILNRRQLEQLQYRRDVGKVAVEPSVAYRSTRWDQFAAEAPFDFICLIRSPPYTPLTADPLYEEIRERFIV